MDASPSRALSRMGVVVLAACVGLGVVSVGSGFLGTGFETTRGTDPISASPAGLEHASDSCPGLALGTLRVSPGSVAVGASSVQTFVATAFSTCGTNLTNVTHFSWRLSSTSVGSLGSDEGASVVYTACIAPMDGILHLQGTYNGTTLTANATIKIAGGGGSPPGTPAVATGGGGQGLWSGKAVGIALMGILIAGGVAVFLWGQRQDRPKSPG